ncbi:MAG: DUF3833 family protein, partial [Lysobacteraceae bacterium]
MPFENHAWSDYQQRRAKIQSSGLAFGKPLFLVLDVMMKSTALLSFVLAAVIVDCGSFAAEKQLEFTPQNGFGGDSAGTGSLNLFFGKARPFHVESHGSAQSDGTFRLEQTITFQGKPPEHRVWILTTVRPHHYSARLSDAAGPVTGSSSGPHLSLRYRVKGPLVMHQELELLPDGKTIDN